MEIHPYEPYIFAGVETITNSFMGEIGGGLLRIYLMSFDLVKNLRNCKMEPAITPCVDKYNSRVNISEIF